MDFATSVRTCFAKYVDFSGRARRSEFWWFVLFTAIVGIVASVVDTALGTDYDVRQGGLVNTLASLVLVLPQLAVGARRLHDIGRSGWWQLLGIIPVIGWIFLLVWFCTDSRRRDNQYGPSPKQEPGTYEPPTPPPPYGSGSDGS
ncbi:DUF805 domain-containing protein [Nocardioides cavernae]|uniref:DUF805 domain-containing protein n=1 Tax=Nocardioides TaxID=1839 RepID=UPI000AF230BB|nr:MULTISPECIES: DUF805 domain-containing protein [Nocardioides]MCK9824004.1 DUF805 domain-containing protein [Nocardioides cavernae]